VVLAEALHRLGAKPVILHFNHRWRGRVAEADARWVKAWGKKRNLRFVPGRAAKPGRTGEGEAREVRWKFFEKSMRAGKLPQLWLAHQSDDQAETVLMQLLRGAGPEGLAGMGEVSRRDSFEVVRPLLGFSREEIRQAAREAGLSWREDKTNEDGKSWRVRIRKKVFPFLAKMYGRDVRRALTRTAEILSGEADYWQKEIGVLPPHPDVRFWRKKPAAWQRRAIRIWLMGRGFEGANFSEVEGVRRLIAGRTVAAWQLRGGAGVRRSGNKLFYLNKMGLIAKGISR
ncbi:MAG: tRNA lysidine(34) synthetase TilS, partial [Verrucomicrobiota bacterium]|jgi:tRNA(Ile)-lysidine synthase